MSQMSGADVAALRQLGHQMETAAQALQHAVTALASSLASATWRGADAQGFRQLWEDTLRVDLATVADALQHQGSSLRRQADDQEGASSGGALGFGGAGGAVGGAGLGHGSGPGARPFPPIMLPPDGGGFPQWDPRDPGTYDRDGDGYVDGCFPTLPGDDPGFDTRIPTLPGNGPQLSPGGEPRPWDRHVRFPAPPGIHPGAALTPGSFPRDPGFYAWPDSPRIEVSPFPPEPRTLPFPPHVVHHPEGPWQPHPFPLPRTGTHPWPPLQPLPWPIYSAI